MAGPPDPSAPDAFENRIRDIVNQVLSDPLGYPDQFVSWFNDQLALQAPTVSSSSGLNTQPPTL